MCDKSSPYFHHPFLSVNEEAFDLNQVNPSQAFIFTHLRHQESYIQHFGCQCLPNYPRNLNLENLISHKTGQQGFEFASYLI